MDRKPAPRDKKLRAKDNAFAHRPQRNATQTASSSSRTPARSAADEEERRIFAEQISNTKDSCSICLDEFLDNYLASLTCRHKICNMCLTDMFKSSTTDESRYPPKCCHPIPIATVRGFINREVAEEFEHKMMEWETQNRTYCSNKDCRAFIRMAQIYGKWAICERCDRTTCTDCKTVAHGTEPCPEDEATQQALGLMEQEGYKRCSQCQNGVELMDGCNHITCVCGYEFCYVCGIVWKTCRCPKYGNPARNHNPFDPAGGQAPRAPPPRVDPWAQGPPHAWPQAPLRPAFQAPWAQAPRLYAPPLQWDPPPPQPDAHAARRETHRQATEARRRDTDARRQQTLDRLERLNLGPGHLEPGVDFPFQARPAPQAADNDRDAFGDDLAPVRHDWPQMGDPRNQGMRLQPNP